MRRIAEFSFALLSFVSELNAQKDIFDVQKREGLLLWVVEDDIFSGFKSDSKSFYCEVVL
jgi:hypothetical protein